MNDKEVTIIKNGGIDHDSKSKGSSIWLWKNG